MKVGLLLVTKIFLISQSTNCYYTNGFFNATLGDSTYPVTLKILMQHYFITASVEQSTFPLNSSSVYYLLFPEKNIDYILYDNFASDNYEIN